MLSLDHARGPGIATPPSDGSPRPAAGADRHFGVVAGLRSGGCRWLRPLVWPSHSAANVPTRTDLGGTPARQRHGLCDLRNAGILGGRTDGLEAPRAPQ